ncbi:MAG TPA: type II secretion system protein GspM [Candidatus Binataceae bacterium]|nr:type II secretion system protein GspM [Candidatus Binataceae bacterium]
MNARERIADAWNATSAAAYVQDFRLRYRAHSRRLWDRYYKLEPRERRLLQLGLAALAIFFAYNLIYSPVLSLQASLTDAIQARQRELNAVRRMTVNYQELQRQVTKLEKQTAPAGPDFALSSVLTQALGAAIGSTKIGGVDAQPPKKISPQFSQYEVALRLSGVSLAQLVDGLYAIKSLKVPVVVSGLTIKKQLDQHDAYDVDLTCQSLARNG